MNRERARKSVAQQSAKRAGTLVVRLRRQDLMKIIYVILGLMVVVAVGAVAILMLGVLSGTALGTAGGVVGSSGLCGFEICFYRVLRLTLVPVPV